MGECEPWRVHLKFNYWPFILNRLIGKRYCVKYWAVNKQFMQFVMGLIEHFIISIFTVCQIDNNCLAKQYFIRWTEWKYHSFPCILIHNFIAHFISPLRLQSCVHCCENRYYNKWFQELSVIDCVKRIEKETKIEIENAENWMTEKRTRRAIAFGLVSETQFQSLMFRFFFDVRQTKFTLYLFVYDEIVYLAEKSTILNRKPNLLILMAVVKQRAILNENERW